MSYTPTPHSSRDWWIDSSGRLMLQMSVRVNGKTLSAGQVHDTLNRLDTLDRHGKPAPYIERELRAHLMREVESELLGPRT